MAHIPDCNELYDRYEAEQERKLAPLPLCTSCGEPIQQETAVFLDKDWYCDECLEFSRRDVEGYDD